MKCIVIQVWRSSIVFNGILDFLVHFLLNVWMIGQEKECDCHTSRSGIITSKEYQNTIGNNNILKLLITQFGNFCSFDFRIFFEFIFIFILPILVIVVLKGF